MKKNILRDIKHVIYSSLFVKTMDIVKNYFIIRVLSPYDYGLLSIFNQIKNLSKYGDFGFLNVLERDYNSNISNKKAQYIRDVSFSLDFVLLVFIALLLSIVAHFFFEVNSLLLFAAIVSVIAYRLFRIFQTENRIKLNFTRFSKCQVFISLISSCLIILTIAKFGLLAPTLFNALLVLFLTIFLLFYFSFNFKFQLKWAEFERQVKVGIKISSITIAFGCGLYVERFIFVKYADVSTLGYFSFCLFIVTLCQQLSSDFNRPLIPRVRHYLAASDFKSINEVIFKPLLLAYLIAAFSCLVVYFIPEDLFLFFFPQYIDAFVSLKIIIWVILLGIPSVFYGYIMYSKNINLEYHSVAIHLIYATLFLLFASVETDFEYIIQISLIFLFLNSLRVFLQTALLFYYVPYLIPRIILTVVSFQFLLSGGVFLSHMMDCSHFI